MNSSDLIFFQGSSKDYFEILKATYEAVKEADSESYVVQGGMAGMDDWMVSFWQDVLALANGAEKLFYVNLRLPPFFPSEAEGGPGFSDLSTSIDSSGKPTPLFSAHQRIALELGSFREVETIEQQVRGKTIIEGQYRFSKDDRVIYALWGKGRLPSEIKGQVRLTDISGNEEIITSESIRLTSSPIFIEIIE